MQENEFEVRLRDLLILHAGYLARYSNGLKNRIIKTLNSTLRGLEAQLAARLIKIDERGLDMGPATTRRLDGQIKEINALVKQAYKATNETILTELGALAEDEVAFTTSAIQNVKASITKDSRPKGTLTIKQAGTAKKAVKLEIQYPTLSPAPQMIRAIVDTSPMSGRHLKAWTDKLSKDTQDEIERVIRDGMTQAKTTDQIVRDIVGTRANKYSDGILQASRRSAESLVRTAVTHIHNVAAQMSYAENSDVVKGWKYLATLDYRTTRTCMGLAGRVFEIGKGPIPPNHVRCRSICQPVTVTLRELGVDADEGTGLTRASVNGPVKGDITHDEWMKGQSAAVQDDMLGPIRAKKFRAGTLSLKDFVADDGREFTLAELRAKHPTAF